jgi:hypothetical protein
MHRGVNESTGKHDSEPRSLEPASAEDGAGEHGLGAGAPEGRGGGPEDSPYARVESSPRVPASASSRRRCLGTTKSGQPCQSFPIAAGYCAVHSGRVDPKKIGAKGGLHSPLTKIRKALSGEEDEHVRAQAKDLIRRGMAGDPSITKLQLDAARSVFSYRAEVPAQERPEADLRHPGRGVFSIVDLTRLACERHIFSQGNGVPVELEDAMAKALAEAPDSAD